MMREFSGGLMAASFTEKAPRDLNSSRRLWRRHRHRGLRPLENQWDEVGAAVDNSLQDIKYYIFYYSFMRPSFREYHIDDETEFEVEVIDTWNMTIEKKGIFKGKFRIDLLEENIWLYVYERSNDHFAGSCL